MPNREIHFADVVHQTLSFQEDVPEEALVLRLIDTPWVQRLRDVAQTANTRLVYMCSEHSRFGHSLGVAYLSCLLLRRLSKSHPQEIQPFRAAVSVAALLHDVGHLAPGSHIAAKTWFPQEPDAHELTASRIVQTDESLRRLLDAFSPSLAEQVALILTEAPSLPSWTWEILSGGGWNVDRGNWCMLDSIMAGVSYGKYNIDALINSITLAPDGHLALRENRLDAMMHFVVSRHAMYRQLYQHRVLLAADKLNQALVQRARARRESVPFEDNSMSEVLEAKHLNDVSLSTIMRMNESWWRYHLTQWKQSSDEILADLSTRLLERRLFKTVRIRQTDKAEKLQEEAREAVQKTGFDPDYYLHEITTTDMLGRDLHNSMPVLMESGEVKSLAEAEPLSAALIEADISQKRRWLAMPAEAKAILGRQR